MHGYYCCTVVPCMYLFSALLYSTDTSVVYSSTVALYNTSVATTASYSRYSSVLLHYTARGGFPDGLVSYCTVVRLDDLTHTTVATVYCTVYMFLSLGPHHPPTPPTPTHTHMCVYSTCASIQIKHLEIAGRSLARIRIGTRIRTTPERELELESEPEPERELELESEPEPEREVQAYA